MGKRKTDVQIVTIQNVRGYCDESGTVFLNAEDVACGLGFVQVKKDRVPTCGDKLYLSSDESCINEDNRYVVVRWERINRYLSEFGYKTAVGKGDYIPENMVYRLAMKANNETAQAFQAKVADEILPEIRRTGSYTSAQARVNLVLEAFMSLIEAKVSKMAEERYRKLPETPEKERLIAEKKIQMLAEMAEMSDRPELTAALQDRIPKLLNSESDRRDANEK